MELTFTMAPPPMPAHRRDHGLHCQQRCVDVELGDGPQVIEPDLLQWHMKALAGIVDEHVHASEAIQRGVHKPDDLGGLPEVGEHSERIGHVVRQLFDPVPAARCQHHLCSTSGRQSGGRRPDARRSSRDDDDRAVEFHGAARLVFRAGRSFGWAMRRRAAPRSLGPNAFSPRQNWTGVQVCPPSRVMNS